VLVEFYRRGALDRDRAVRVVTSDATGELQATGMIEVSDGQARLTDLGATIAHGLLRIYP
jgi:hypothetical protein